MSKVFYFLSFTRNEFVTIKVFLFNNNNGKQLIMNLTDQICYLFQLVNE